MMGPNVYRGQPLVVLGVLVGGWVAVRALMWDASGPPRHEVVAYQGPVMARVEPGELAPAHEPAPLSIGTYWSPLPPVEDAVAAPRAAPRAAPLARQAVPFFIPPAGVARIAAASDAARASVAAVQGNAARVVAGHQLMWMAALARQPVLASLVSYRAPQAAPLSPSATSASIFNPPLAARRWSGDGWLLMRRGGGAGLAASGASATYGASQAGAVLRYRLDLNSAHRPAAYARVTMALNGSLEKEAALGVLARPWPGVPVVAAAEMRATAVPGATRLRPAAFAYTELPPQDLPLETRAETYLQAGYVGGSFATSFIDGQLRIDRKLTRLGPTELRAGGGVWGGAQRGASRLDVGPSATLTASGSGTAAARVGVDWRFRVAGEAAPASGPAVTLSAGF